MESVGPRERRKPRALDNGLLACNGKIMGIRDDRPGSSSNDRISIKNEKWVLWAQAALIGISKDIPALKDPSKQKLSINLGDRIE